MATTKWGDAIARIATNDLTGKLFYLAKLDATGQFVLAGSGDAVFGAIIEEAVAGKPATVLYNGLSKVIAGASIAAGDRLQSDVNGKAITLAGGVGFGMAVSGPHVAGDIFEFAFTR